MIDAVVDILGAVLAGEAGHALASVVGEVVDALAAIFAWVELGCLAERDLGLAEVPGEASGAGAGVVADAIDAGGVVLTPVPVAIINVNLTSGALISSRAHTPK